MNFCDGDYTQTDARVLSAEPDHALKNDETMLTRRGFDSDEQEAGHPQHSLGVVE